MSQKKEKYENIFYTPKFSSRATIAVRRLSWVLNKPMTQVINSLIEVFPYMIDTEKVCQKCKIKDKCKYCPFNNPKMADNEQAFNFLSVLIKETPVFCNDNSAEEYK
jgi:hypothetical protein